MSNVTTTFTEEEVLNLAACVARSYSQAVDHGSPCFDAGVSRGDAGECVIEIHDGIKHRFFHQTDDGWWPTRCDGCKRCKSAMQTLRHWWIEVLPREKPARLRAIVRLTIFAAIVSGLFLLVQMLSVFLWLLIQLYA